MLRKRNDATLNEFQKVIRAATEKGKSAMRLHPCFRPPPKPLVETLLKSLPRSPRPLFPSQARSSSSHCSLSGTSMNSRRMSCPATLTLAPSPSRHALRMPKLKQSFNARKKRRERNEGAFGGKRSTLERGRTPYGADEVTRGRQPWNVRRWDTGSLDGCPGGSTTTDVHVGNNSTTVRMP